MKIIKPGVSLLKLFSMEKANHLSKLQKLDISHQTASVTDIIS
jgi:hypothetical protein